MTEREEMVESEEEEVQEEEAEEEEVDEAEGVENASDTCKETTDEFKRRLSSMQKTEDEPKQLTEAEMAMMAAKKRHEEEEAAKMQEYEERRREERERIDQELKELKQKQIERKKQREEEYREMAERRMEEEKRKHEEELERRARLEAKRRQKEEERRKKHDLSSGFEGTETERNYTVSKKGDAGKTKNAEVIEAEKQEAKKNYLATISGQKLGTNNMLSNDLKEKIKLLHAKICKLEADKFDLEKRSEIQEYDLKELRERQLQVARHKALKKGLNPDEAVASLHPPKVNVASKFDRQIDRRSYNDRRDLYEHPVIPKPLKVVHGTARPPPEWGRRDLEELEIIRKMTDRRHYVEVVRAEGDAAKPPIAPIPLSLPEDSDNEEIINPKESKAEQLNEEEQSEDAKLQLKAPKIAPKPVVVS